MTRCRRASSAATTKDDSGERMNPSVSEFLSDNEIGRCRREREGREKGFRIPGLRPAAPAMHLRRIRPEKHLFAARTRLRALHFVHCERQRCCASCVRELWKVASRNAKKRAHFSRSSRQISSAALFACLLTANKTADLFVIRHRASDSIAPLLFANPRMKF